MSKKKTVKPIVELTREEKIAQAVQRRQSDMCFKHGEIEEVTESRKLKIGDEVIIGNLKDAVVCYVTNDYKFVVVDYMSTCNNYGNPIDTPAIGCWLWYYVTKKQDAKKTRFAYSTPYLSRKTTIAISTLISRELNYGFNFLPEYQREYVWTIEDKRKLIESIFNDRDIGKVVVLKYAWNDQEEVLDGKQRIQTLVEFFLSKFDYCGVYFHEMSHKDQYKFEENTMIQYVEVDANGMNEADKIKLFLTVNVGGVPQSEEHLTKLRVKLMKLESEIML